MKMEFLTMNETPHRHSPCVKGGIRPCFVKIVKTGIIMPVDSKTAIAIATKPNRLRNLGMIGMKVVNLNGATMIMRMKTMEYKVQIIITIKEPWDDRDVYTALEDCLEGFESEIPKVVINIESFERIVNRRGNP